MSLVQLEQAKPPVLHSAAKHAKQAGQQKKHNMTCHAMKTSGFWTKEMNEIQTFLIHGKLSFFHRFAELFQQCEKMDLK